METTLGVMQMKNKFLCPESLNVEKLDEMSDYETTNRVSRSNRISTTILNKNPSGQLLK